MSNIVDDEIDALWLDILEKTDRTSPYPDMALITKEEFIENLKYIQKKIYENTAKSYGACMTCLHGAPDYFGCSDCLNTGYENGAPPGFMKCQ